ncbi:EAL domain-containing protein [Aestuariibacter sp. AA17]|uniref:EAL domain-containing protein n=1 Tax=Fluctibacter corallii TaxID=2984329 RepID=A0ABT3A8J7_9ALTE|nr:EAL domain-containing protein [Aestuariibacter sp. AA17]MCV2885010.1 EAL domain-containing protein [Aestuariibacter sp. AA17]
MQFAGAKLLVVEDDSVSSALIRESLKAYGYENLYLAEDLASAHQLLAVNRFDLVLLDVGLPDGTGGDLLVSIRKRFSAVALPVIMISGDVSSTHIVNFLELGANDYISKPLDIPVLLARVKNVLTIRQLDKDIGNANERYSLAARGAKDGLWDWSIQTGEIFLSSRWMQIIGADGGECTKDISYFIERIHEDDVLNFNRDLRNHLNGVNDYFQHECRMQHTDGSFRWTLVRGTAIRHTNGKAYRMAGSISDITARKVLDPLTSTLNRSAFLDKLDMLIKSRTSKLIKHFAVVVISVDRYQLVSDSYGHHFGDRVMLEVTNRLSALVSPKDTIARIETDQLAFTLEDAGSEEEIVAWARREILRPIVIPLPPEDRSLHLTFSAAVINDTDIYRYSHDILRDANIALHDAMKKIDDDISAFRSSLQISLKDRIEMLEDLHDAIEQDSFYFCYQPKVDFEGNLCGAEALIRWKHPVKGEVSPVEFIPIAEETGLIVPLGHNMFKKFCKVVKQVEDKQRGILMSYNLSGRQFLDPSLLDVLMGCIKEAGVSADSIELEITESTLMNDIESAVQVLKELTKHGFKVSIDDFGTGYSSLAYLKKLPIHTLKIDKSFVDDLLNDADDIAIISAITNMANALGLTTVAEGVEVEQQAEKLHELEIDMFQGYCFYKPLEESAFLALLK